MSKNRGFKDFQKVAPEVKTVYTVVKNYMVNRGHGLEGYALSDTVGIFDTIEEAKKEVLSQSIRVENSLKALENEGKKISVLIITPEIYQNGELHEMLDDLDYYGLAA